MECSYFEKLPLAQLVKKSWPFWEPNFLYCFNWSITVHWEIRCDIKIKKFT